MPRKLYSPLEKQNLYSKFKNSDLSLADFALENGVSKSAFGKWVKEIDSRQKILTRQEIDNILKPILTQQPTVQEQAKEITDDKVCIEFIMPNNIIIKLPIGKDIHLLVEILQAIII